MKKTFKLTHEKIKPARLVEKFKYEVKKYVKRERRRSLPKSQRMKLTNLKIKSMQFNGMGNNTRAG